jgi:hypothetical protein
MAMPKMHFILQISFWRRIHNGPAFQDMANDEFPIPAHEANKIMHIALPIGKNF